MHDFASRRAAVLEYVKVKHAGQMRSDGTVPAWQHLDRVSRYLEMTLADTGEGTPEERESIALAGLCHDTLEDTDATPAEIEALAGARALAFTEGMTNRLGDDHPEPYVRQVAAAEEATRLIKLADLYDNTTGVVYMLYTLGVPWTESYYLPIVTPMIAALKETSFTTYPRSAERLKAMVLSSFATLHEEIARYRSRGADGDPRRS